MTTTHHAWHAAPGKTCDCGQPATVVYQTKHGDVPYCGPHARIGEMDDVAPNELPDPGTLSLAEVLGELTMIAALELGTGLVNEEGETGGQLDGPVVVRFTTVLGADHAVTMEDGTATVWLDDMLAPIQQLRALLQALEEHCISPYKLLR